MALADALNQVVADLTPLLTSLAEKTDPQSQADYEALAKAINSLTNDAMQANAIDVESKLSTSADAQKRLAAFTAQADAQAQALAKQQQNVKNFVSLATHVGQLVVAASTGNVLGGTSSALDVCNDLNIHV
jgi:hypothetical protein